MKKLLLFLLVLLASSVGAQTTIIGGGGGGFSSGSAASGCTAYSLVYVDSSGNLACALAPVNGSVSTAGRSILTIADTMVGTSATSNFLNVTGTFPSGTFTASTIISPVLFNITAGGTANSAESAAVRLKYNTGTPIGGGGAYGAFGILSDATLRGSTSYGAPGVYTSAGIGSRTTATTASEIVASLWGHSVSAANTIGMAVLGEATGAGTTNIGVVGRASGATNNLSGYFTLGSSNPTGTASLIADNGAVAANIFEARDNGTAVFTIADGGTTTMTGTLAVPTGTAAMPFPINNGTGGMWFSSGFPQFSYGTNNWLFGGVSSPNIGLAVRSTGNLGFASADTFSGLDTFFGRESAAVMQMGADANGAAVPQTLKAHDGIIGTDIAGANLTLAAGRGTGAGVGGNLALQTSVPLTTGTTAQSLASRQLIVASPKSVNDNTATTLFTITMGDDTDSGGTVFFCSTATSATTDRQKTCGQINFSAIDVTAGAGGEACSSAITGTNSTAVSVGTLTVTSAATTGTDLCNVQITSDSSLNVAHIIRYSVVMHPGSSATVITPQ